MSIRRLFWRSLHNWALSWAPPEDLVILLRRVAWYPRKKTKHIATQSCVAAAAAAVLNVKRFPIVELVKADPSHIFSCVGGGGGNETTLIHYPDKK